MQENRYKTTSQEHILVCLSSSFTNEKLIYSSSALAKAFHCPLTALYIQTSSASHMKEDDVKRLSAHTALAKSLGAEIVQIQGDDVPVLISEYARASRVTKIVIGRSDNHKRMFFPKQTVTDRLIELSKNIDIYIIPDQSNLDMYRKGNYIMHQDIMPKSSDILPMGLILLLVTGIGICFQHLGFTDSNIITLYILGVLLTALICTNYTSCIISSVLSVIAFNYFFTEPVMTLHAYAPGYPVTFLIMLIAGIITGSSASKLKQDARLLASDAYRTKVLFDTDKLLENTDDPKQIILLCAQQLSRLLNRKVLAISKDDDHEHIHMYYPDRTFAYEQLSKEDEEAVQWVFENHKQKTNRDTLYLSIRMNEIVYGVIGIIQEDTPINPHESSIALSILGECALALDNERIKREKEQAALVAKNEQLRSNLLRTISHDLRTPLTSISGGASILMDSYQELDDAARKQIFSDIYDDSEWLKQVVENLLSITRFDEGRIQLNFSDQLLDDVMSEALKHIDRKSQEHHIEKQMDDELMLVYIDARLIIQVIVNIINNAIKYTEAGSTILIRVKKLEHVAQVDIIDNGPGIKDVNKEHIFEMFYTGEKQNDSTGRSLGLGLALCKSIIEAHHGEIGIYDAEPHGCDFRFTLPLSEVKINGE